MDELNMVELGGEQVSLADLAGLDLDTFQEKRVITFPVGVFQWEIMGDPSPPKLQSMKGTLGVPFSLKCVGIVDVKNVKDCPDGDPTKLVGQNHRETFFISAMEDFGWLKAFLIDAGLGGKGNIPALLAGSVGTRFQAPIVHTPNRKNSDAPPYVNLDRSQGKIRPVKKAA